MNEVTEAVLEGLRVMGNAALTEAAKQSTVNGLGMIRRALMKRFGQQSDESWELLDRLPSIKPESTEAEQLRALLEEASANFDSKLLEMSRQLKESVEDAKKHAQSMSMAHVTTGPTNINGSGQTTIAIGSPIGTMINQNTDRPS